MSSSPAPSGSYLTETSDALAGVGTAYGLLPGAWFRGFLNSPTDSDWIAIEVEAGQTYTIGLTGIGALDDGVDDTYLRLRDASGALVDENDDAGYPGFLFSNLTFTATYTGIYYVDAQSWETSQGGAYGVSFVEGGRASYDAYMAAGVLMRSDTSWSGASGTGATITWALRASGPAADASGNSVTFETLSAAQAAAVADVLASFSAVADVTFVQVNAGGTSDDATMLFGAYTSSSDGAGAFAYYPGSTASAAAAGDVWLNNTSISQTALPTGTFSHFAILHEVGHAMGLSHPGDYNAGPGVSITYAQHARFTEDSQQYTVMSYFDEANTTESFSSYADGLLLFDILALQQLYGVNSDHESGDSIYGFNCTVGGIYDFTVNDDPVLCIWDGGGTDTLDLSGFSMDQAVSLVAGVFSDVGGLVGNLSIAFGALIENAVGGTGSDAIGGNDAANEILGKFGEDTIDGGAGDDRIYGQRGHDTIDGGHGNDGLYGGYGDDTLLGGDGKDVLYGGIGDDLMQGDQGTDHIVGDVGDDTATGGGGADTIYGNAGKDDLSGGTGGDWIHGGAGTDVIAGDAGNDTLTGGSGADAVTGGDGYDLIAGGSGGDTLTGGAQADTLTGGSGADVFVFETVSDSAIGAGEDLITDFETGLDHVDLSALAAGLTLSIGGGLTGTGPSARTAEAGGDTMVFVDADGDGSSDLRVTLQDATGVTAGDFIL
ncbi:M10 family metallopeptidase C-terminal domain-containing protein [Psychromarinibacter sp. S121]|uniref:M10 family metallopeptidase C-terminal domain-containing protein n=1 Tax=Psychromarinibacter sp. S121 TaxID=3415127 RepID=UPI003C7A85B3